MPLTSSCTHILAVDPLSGLQGTVSGSVSGALSEISLQQLIQNDECMQW